MFSLLNLSDLIDLLHELVEDIIPGQLLDGLAVDEEDSLALAACNADIGNEVEKRLQGYKKSIKVAVMGCVVNGPGEAREADIGIAGGKGEAVLFIHGKPIKKLTGDNILDQFMDEIYKL